MAWQNEETYVYDETNHMVDGKNEKGEHSLYTYNGLGLRVGRELIMQDNTHGYTDFHDETPSVETGLNKPEVAVESYVIDYTSPTFRTLTMEEEGGFDYRWVYGLDKLSVKITSEGTNWWGQNVKQDILKDYLHQDRLGSTTNLTDKFGRVVGRADYNEWGEITYKDALDITSAYRRIYPQLNYTGHDWDDVLEMYYAKARFYDPDAKRFVEIDPVKGSVTDPLSLVSYLYCVDNPLGWVDPLGLKAEPGGAGGAYKPNYPSATIYINGERYDDLAILRGNTTYIKKDQVEYFAQKIGINNGQLVEKFEEYGPAFWVGNKELLFEEFGGEYYMKLRCLTTTAGVNDTVSWWSDHGVAQVLVNSEAKNAYLNVQRSGDNINVTIYAKPTGLAYEKIPGTNTTYWNAIRTGVTTFWNKDYDASKYDYFGDSGKISLKVSVKTIDSKNSERVFAEINVIDPTDPAGPRSNTGGARDPRTPSLVTMMTKSSKGTTHGEKDMQYIGAHEFGHLFMVGDSYHERKENGETITTHYPANMEVFSQSIMRVYNGTVTPNEVEMLWTAWLEGMVWQAFSKDEDGGKSKALRLPTDEEWWRTGK